MGLILAIFVLLTCFLLSPDISAVLVSVWCETITSFVQCPKKLEKLVTHHALFFLLSGALSSASLKDEMMQAK